MISVCMATFNGEKYVKEQIDSILCQLGKDDELLISDDASTDKTALIVKSYHDSRMKLILGPEKGLIKNFENALYNSVGDTIFLADQDDVWEPGKVNRMLEFLKYSDVVVSDCKVTDLNLKPLYESFFILRNSNVGLIKNIMRNSYLGCCMAFKRKVLTKALPFPDNIPMHDWWLGVVAEVYYKPFFLKEPLLLYRRHDNNCSSTAEKSTTRLSTIILWRVNLLVNLTLLRIKSRC